MKNRKWSVKSKDDRPMHVVLFVSRNKDNKHIEGHTERRHSFVSKEPSESDVLYDEFQNFIKRGVKGEVCRFYYSVNARDEQKIRQELQHFLISNPDFNLCAIPSKLAGIAAINSNAATKHWMFDFDIDDHAKAKEFCEDIQKIDKTVKAHIYKTPNGYAIVVDHGFDTRTLLTKWNENVTLKRDDLLCYGWDTCK